ncbi:MAG: energy-coupling factor transporter ATPase [Oscillospiraceae bacterium]|nr:energy-coupling factor transporter ATPase [Oscillospiraceae bacterium]
MEQIFETQRLSFQYQTEPGVSGALVLKEIDLSIESGSFVAIVGHNGSGKSTLAKLSNGILLPTGGKVYVEGLDTMDRTLLLEIRRRVGVVFQNPDNQIVSNLVEDDVAFAPENLGLPPEDIRRRVDAALKAVDMYDYRLHAPHLLSGGQKQRVAIAGIIAMRPRLIVLDEPTAMLDPQGRKEVIDTVKQLCREHGITVALITHHMNECIDADRLVVLSDGEIVLDGTPVHVFTQVEKLSELGLAPPETTALLFALGQMGLNVPLDALDVTACAQTIYDSISK